MTEKRRRIVVFGILALAIIWGIWNNPFASRKPAPTGPGSADDPDPQQLAQIAGINGSESARPALYDDWKDDPFARTRAIRTISKRTTESTPRFRLTAISRQGEGLMAVLDGQVVGLGSTISGWRVTAIGDSTVTLKNGSKSLTLKI